MALGISMFILSQQVFEFKADYSVKCAGEETCLIDMQIDEKVEAPVYLYYSLHRFYQNHRRYVKSRSNIQKQSTT